MRAVSKKRAQQMRAYMKLRGPFLEANRLCAFPLGCGRPAEVVHHTRGRSGLRLLDTSWWQPSCIAHNNYAETHTGHSLEIGWLHRIEGNAA